jgi:hypothetical protein
MSSRRRTIHPQETYRFSMTHTLSDYPLLIGEILRRDQLRAIQQAKRRAMFVVLRRALGMRVPRAVGTRKNPLVDSDLAGSGSPVKVDSRSIVVQKLRGQENRLN